MKIDEIKTIVKLMAENDLTEFKIEAEEMHLCIRRGSQTLSANIIPQVIQQAAPAPVVQAASASAPAPAASSSPAAPAAPLKSIDSPIVGTFYKSPSPESPSFVKPGDKVEADTVVCIVEAMKVMNEIKAEKSGIIKAVLIENGTPVEFGQPLFSLE